MASTQQVSKGDRGTWCGSNSCCSTVRQARKPAGGVINLCLGDMTGSPKAWQNPSVVGRLVPTELYKPVQLSVSLGAFQ